MGLVLSVGGWERMELLDYVMVTFLHIPRGVFGVLICFLNFCLFNAAFSSVLFLTICIKNDFFILVYVWSMLSVFL